MNFDGRKDRFERRMLSYTQLTSHASICNTEFEFEFLYCLTMPGLSKDIQHHTQHPNAPQQLSIIIITINP